MVHRVSSSISSPSASPLRVFEQFYAHRSHSVWLDSSSYPSRGELDILAAPSLPGDIIEYHVDDKAGDGAIATGTDILSRLENELFGGVQNGTDLSANQNIGWVKMDFRGNDGDNDKNDEEKEGHLLEWVRENEHNLNVPDAETLPFHYRGGFLGFLGYEVRRDTLRHLQRLEEEAFTDPFADDAAARHRPRRVSSGAALTRDQCTRMQEGVQDQPAHAPSKIGRAHV